MEDELRFRIVAREGLTRDDCPWFNPDFERGDPKHQRVVLAYAGDDCVSYALFEGPDESAGDIELQYVANAPGHERRGFAFRTIAELVRRFPRNLVWAVDAHRRAPILLQRAGFASPDEVRRRHGGFRVEGAWVRFPR